jgi:hypothetical protein
MSDEEIIKQYDAMLEMFGTLPNPEQEPRQFAHAVKLYKYYSEREQLVEKPA